MTRKTTRTAGTLRLAVALSLLACQHTTAPASQSHSAAPSPPAAKVSVLALGYENDLVEFDLNTGRPLRRQALGARPSAASSVVPGHYLAFSSDGQTVYGLIRRSDQAAAVVALDRRTLARRWSTELPAQAGQPRALAVGLRTGTVFAFTNNTVGPGIQGFGPRAEAVVSELDSGGTLRASVVVRGPDLASSASEDWFILDGLVNADETRLYASFHNQGLFDFDLTLSGPIPRCSGQMCLDAHGDVALWNGSILTATGSRELHLISTKGVLQATFDTQLDRNHLMAFALDPVAQFAYAIGSCEYVPGMTSINLKTGEPRVIVLQAASSQPCGDRVVFAKGRLLVGPAVKVIDPLTGAILVNTRLSAIDMLA